MKLIMRLPSISTLKSYINESEQRSGWQDKIAYQMLASLTTNKIWGYGQMGFFSHDSFKIQKGKKIIVKFYKQILISLHKEIFF